MLDLCLKNYLKFEISQNEKVKKNEKIIININKEKLTTSLPESEAVIFEILTKVAGEELKPFTMKDFEKYAEKNNTSFYNAISKINSIATKEEDSIGNYSIKEKSQSNKYIGIAVVNIILGVFEIILAGIASMFVPALLFIIPAILIILYNIIMLSRLALRFTGLTQTGVDEKEKLRALKKYMEDFSLLKEREVPELVLWERYLVYATTMGIADKVLQQLKVVYPQLLENNNINSDMRYLYMMSYSNFGSSMITTINNSVNKAYLSSAPSSSSGGGGGFSGGGGGGRRWRF